MKLGKETIMGNKEELEQKEWGWNGQNTWKVYMKLPDKSW